LISGQSISMVIDKKVLDYMSHLSKLKIDDEKQEEMLESLEKILGYISSLEECDTENTEITYNVLGLENVMRDDTITPSFDREDILKNAPSKEAGCFIVPKVLS